MAKKLRQIATKNPSLDYIKPPTEKKWAGSQSGLKTNAAPYVAPQFNKDDADAEEKHFKGVKGASPRPGKSASPDQGPKDSYGNGNYFLNITKSGKEVVPEETIEEKTKKPSFDKPVRAHGVKKPLKQIVKSGAQSSDDEKNEATKPGFTKSVGAHHSLKAQPLSPSGQGTGTHKYSRDAQQGVIKLPKQGTTVGKFASNDASRMPPPKTGKPGTNIKDPLKTEGQHSYDKGGDLAPHHLGDNGSTKGKNPSAPSDIGNTTTTTAVTKGGNVNKFDKAAYVKSQTWGTDKTKKPSYANPSKDGSAHKYDKAEHKTTMGVPVANPKHSYGNIKNPIPNLASKQATSGRGTQIDAPLSQADGPHGHSYGKVRNPMPHLGDTGTKIHSPSEETVLDEKNWIQNAVNPKHKGYCTPMTKPTCTPRRKALAKRFKSGDLNKEEAEQLDEISKDKLINYVGKASQDVSNRGLTRGVEIGQSKFADKGNFPRKQGKRMAGISQAARKLAGQTWVKPTEEIEMEEPPIQENKEKLGAYIVKARQSVDAMKKGDPKKGKRTLGILRATQKARNED